MKSGPGFLHGVRHTSITTGLDRTRDPRKVHQHARHASMDTTNAL
jgi:hypothetical protein